MTEESVNRYRVVYNGSRYEQQKQYKGSDTWWTIDLFRTKFFAVESTKYLVRKEEKERNKIETVVWGPYP